MSLGFAINLITAGSTAYAVGKGINDFRVNIKKAQETQTNLIEKSDANSILEDFKNILNSDEKDGSQIEIKGNLEKFKIYCKAIEVKDDLNISSNTLDKDKIKAIQTALKALDKSVRNGEKKHLFDVEIDVAEYNNRNLAYKGINFYDDPLGKPKELFNYLFRNPKAEEKTTADSTKKEKTTADSETTADLTKKEEKTPVELKNERIAKNIFILLQEQEKKCIEKVEEATKDTPFDYKDPATLELIKNAKKFGSDGKSNITEAEITQKMKLVHDSNTVLSVEDPSKLDSLQNGQKLCLNYDVFFKEGITLTPKQKEYIKNNAKFITVTVKDNDELLNLTQKMNEIAATASEVIHKDKDNNQTTAKLNNTESLFELLSKNNTDPNTKINKNSKPIDYIKQALFLHHSTENITTDKQDLFKKIINNNQFDAIEKSFPKFMDKIFPTEIKRYNDWDKQYLTDENLKGVFDNLVANIESKDIDGFSPEAKTNIIKQFLESKKFTDAQKTGVEQFNILNQILKNISFKNIPEIKTACEAKATEGKVLEHIFSEFNKESPNYAIIKDFSEDTKIKILKEFLKTPSDGKKVIVMSKDDAFKDILNIKGIIATAATEKNMQLNTQYLDFYNEANDDVFVHDKKTVKLNRVTENSTTKDIINFIIYKSQNEDTENNTSQKNNNRTILRFFKFKQKKQTGINSKPSDENESINIVNKYLKEMFDHNANYANITNEQMNRLLNKAVLEN